MAPSYVHEPTCYAQVELLMCHGKLFGWRYRPHADAARSSPRDKHTLLDAAEGKRTSTRHLTKSRINPLRAGNCNGDEGSSRTNTPAQFEAWSLGAASLSFRWISKDRNTCSVSSIVYGRTDIGWESAVADGLLWIKGFLFFWPVHNKYTHCYNRYRIK